MAHTTVAIILLSVSGFALVLVSAGILALFPNTPTSINPMNYIIPAALFLLTPLVWYAMGTAEGEISG